MPAEVRNTRQKAAIRTAFTTADRPLSPEEVLGYAQQDVPQVSSATVYRNIGTLVDEAWLVRVDIPGEPARYEVAGKKHHHHFRCNDCGNVYELDGGQLMPRPRLPRGFRTTGHEFFLFGTCAACA